MRKILILAALLLLQFPLVVWAYAPTTVKPTVDFSKTAGNTVNKIEVTIPNSTNTDTNQTITVNKATISVASSLKSIISSIVKYDDNFRKVETGDSDVKIDYQQTTKILGLIPAKFNLHIVADPSKKQLNVGRPWWTIFGNTNVRKIFNDLQAGMNKIDRMNLKTTLQKQSQIVQSVSNIMKAEKS